MRTPSLVVGRSPNKPLTCSSTAIVPTFPSGELGRALLEGNTLVGVVSQTLERLRGNRNDKEYGIRRLLLGAISALEKDNEG